MFIAKSFKKNERKEKPATKKEYAEIVRETERNHFGVELCDGFDGGELERCASVERRLARGGGVGQFE